MCQAPGGGAEQNRHDPALQELQPGREGRQQKENRQMHVQLQFVKRGFFVFFQEGL